MNVWVIRLGLTIALVVAIIWGYRQIGQTAVREAQTDAVLEAVQEAVQARDAGIKADVQTRAVRAALRQEIASVAVSAKDAYAAPDCPVDPELNRVLNGVIGKANAGIRSAGSLP